MVEVGEMEKEQGTWKKKKGMEEGMILLNAIWLIILIILIQNKFSLGGKEAEEAVIKNVSSTTGMSRTQTE